MRPKGPLEDRAAPSPTPLARAVAIAAEDDSSSADRRGALLAGDESCSTELAMPGLIHTLLLLSVTIATGDVPPGTGTEADAAPPQEPLPVVPPAPCAPRRPRFPRRRRTTWAGSRPRTISSSAASTTSSWISIGSSAISRTNRTSRRPVISACAARSGPARTRRCRRALRSPDISGCRRRTACWRAFVCSSSARPSPTPSPCRVPTWTSFRHASTRGFAPPMADSSCASTSCADAVRSSTWAQACASGCHLLPSRESASRRASPSGSASSATSASRCSGTGARAWGRRRGSTSSAPSVLARSRAGGRPAPWTR